MKLPIPFVLTLAALAALSCRADQPAQPHAPGIESKGYVWNAPNREETLALAQKGNPVKGKEAFQVCQGCHKADASGQPGAHYPQLAGQHRSVLIKQMVDIRSGERDNPKMHPFISSEVLTTEQIADVAAYLNSLPIPNTNAKGSGENLPHGEAMFIADCADCHGEAGEGDPARFYPRVASQHYDYLLSEAQQIRDGKRRNANPTMVKTIKGRSDADLRDLADYMSRLPAPPAKAAP